MRVSEKPSFKYQSKHANNRQIFTAVEEQELGDYAIPAWSSHFGLSTRCLRKLAYEFAISLD